MRARLSDLCVRPVLAAVHNPRGQKPRRIKDDAEPTPSGVAGAPAKVLHRLDEEQHLQIDPGGHTNHHQAVQGACDVCGRAVLCTRGRNKFSSGARGSRSP